MSKNLDLFRLMEQEIRKRNKENFDEKAYIVNTWLMFLGCDLADSASRNLEAQLRSVGYYSHEFKQHLEKIKKLSSDLVLDVDNKCQRDFSCAFADLAEVVWKEMAALINVRVESVKSINDEKEHQRGLPQG